jgi:hypothetical protein
MPKTAKDTFFKPEKANKSEKSAAENAAFRAIADEELTSRLKKTARLKELRLQKEAEDAKLEPVAKVKGAKKAAKV